jgi:hypothetical protein
VDSQGGRLVVNPKEAEQVRQMYRMAGEAESLEAALRAVQAHGFQTKNWKSRSGRRHAARPFSRMTLRLVLSNVLYTGTVNHKGTVYAGEHPRIVEQELWEQVNAKLLVRNQCQRTRGHGRQEASLKGLLCCAACGSAMLPTYTSKQGRRYRYYLCSAARARAGKNCSQSPVAAKDLETSILRNLEPVLGTGVSWAEVRESIERIQWEGKEYRAAISCKDGTRLEYEMELPSRPGIRGDRSERNPARVPRVSRLMALAIKFEGQVRAGLVRNYGALAAAGQISRARMSQIMSLAELAPEIQEQVLFLPKTVVGPDRITEKELRRIACSLDWEQQRKQFAELVAHAAQ